MSRSKKKPAAEVSDTVTFKKKELLEKLRTFLEDNGACDGSWVNKVAVEFLGMKEKSFDVEVLIPCTFSIDMPVDKTPSKEEMADHIREMIETGDDWCGWSGHMDDDERGFEIKSIKAVDDKE